MPTYAPSVDKKMGVKRHVQPYWSIWGLTLKLMERSAAKLRSFWFRQTFPQKLLPVSCGSTNRGSASAVFVCSHTSIKIRRWWMLRRSFRFPRQKAISSRCVNSRTKSAKWKASVKSSSGVSGCSSLKRPSSRQGCSQDVVQRRITGYQQGLARRARISPAPLQRIAAAQSFGFIWGKTKSQPTKPGLMRCMRKRTISKVPLAHS